MEFHYRVKVMYLQLGVQQEVTLRETLLTLSTLTTLKASLFLKMLLLLRSTDQEEQMVL